MKTAIIKRSVFINGRKTSVSLENEFWDALREIAAQEKVTLSTLVEKIDRRRTNINLSSAIRVFAFNHFRPLAAKAVEKGFLQQVKDEHGGTVDSYTGLRVIPE